MTAVIDAGMIPFYFGTSDKPLYGCYHEPEFVPRRGCGVILCTPLWHEYIYSHRAYRQLALRLSRVGFPVLQFDYYGHGDSGGEENAQASLSQYLTDVSTAVCEIRRRSGLAKVCLVGLRFGGTLSMLSGAERGDVDGLVLWDPVVDGRAYVQEMKTIHRERLGGVPSEPKHGVTDEPAVDILGFPAPRSIIADLEKIDTLAIRRKPANDALVIESDGGRDNRGVEEHLKRTDTRVQYQQLHGPRIWLPDREGGLLVPTQILQAVVSWLSGVQA